MLTWLRREQTINKALLAQANVGRSQRVLKLGSEASQPLPYADSSFDLVLANLMFQRLPTRNKHQALSEIFRVLTPGGELHMVDYGKPHRLSTLIISKAMRHLEYTADLIDGLLPEMIRRAGFVDDEEPGCFTTVFGTLTLYKAKKPVS
jgi:ubiquinone/menaquinone biosynthesis C-methylase UbiE